MITLTQIMTDMIVKIMVELLSVLAIVTKKIQQGRFSECAIIYTCPWLNMPQTNSLCRRRVR